jgi:hypothetical protein
MRKSRNVYTGQQVAKEWEDWCGNTPWIRAARRFGELGGTFRWWGGYPRSASAIPLCFVCILPDGRELSGNSRLSDLRYAVTCAESLANETHSGTA